MNIGMDILEDTIDFGRMTVRGEIIKFSPKKKRKIPKSIQMVQNEFSSNQDNVTQW